MEGDDEVNQAPKVIKGKDLPGAVSVMPGGLGAALAKRKSREVTMEQKENSMTFSSDGQEQTFSTSSASKQESTATATKIQQGTTSSANFSSSSNFQQQSVQKSSFSSSTSSAAAASTQQVKSILKQPSAPKHGEEIHQESLKTTIQSAITDIEEGLDKTDYADKENMAPQQQQQQILQQQQQEAEMMRQEQERLLQQQQEQFRMQQEEQLRIQKQQAMEQSAATNATQNGHFNASDLRLHDEQRAKLRTPHEFKARPESISVPDGLYTPQELDLPDPTTMGKRVETVQQQQQFLVQESHDTTINGSHSEETKHHLSLDQTLGDGSITLGQVMTPCQDQDYDTNSLKRRNPRQMFTDSAFYSPKFHPSVQEQVEMAHALSSSLYTNDNKMSKGQEMYLKRAKKSDDGTTIELLEIPMRTPESAPNLKLVMNPEGKMHDYSDLPEEEVPDMSQMVMVGNPDVAKALAEGMNECKGRGGELFAKRRKKADKWVVDESQIGMGEHPSVFADEFIAQQNMAQQQVHEEKHMEIRAQQQVKDEADASKTAEKQEIQRKQQQIFQEQQLMKQQESQQIKQQQQIRKLSVELPPNFQPTSLKARPFTPSMDLGIHNVQGIDVWAPRGPKPFGKASTISRTTPLAQHLPPQEEAKDEPDYQMMKAQMEGHQQQETVVTETTIQEQQQLIQMQQQQKLIQQQEQEAAIFKQQQQEAMMKQQQQEALFKQQQEHEFMIKQQQETMAKQQQEAMAKQQQEAMAKQQQESMLMQQQQQETMIRQQQEAASVAQAQAQQEKEIAEIKRKEYEEWIRAQEMEAYRLEYDCSVKYEEHGAEKETQASQQIQQQATQLTTNFREERIEKSQIQTQQVVTQQAPMKEPEPPKSKPIEKPKVIEQTKPIEQPKPIHKQPQPLPQTKDKVDFAQTTTNQQKQDLFQSNQTSSFSSSQQQNSFSSSATTGLEHTDISMQMKSGGLMNERNGPSMQINDYVGSLRPSTTGESIRTPAPDAIYTSNRESVYNEEQQLFSQATLKKTQKDHRQSGVFVGIAGDRNSFVENPDDYERKSVRNMIDHFSKTKTGDIPPQFLPQQYSAMQNSGEAPPLSYLKEQANSKDFSFKESTTTSSSVTTKKVKTEDLTDGDVEARHGLFQRRGSLKDYLNIGSEIEEGKANNTQQQSSNLPSILDPSAILQVDGSVEPGLGRKMAMRDSTGREYDSEGRLFESDKWDNHNTIARGWITAGEDHYQPVTFRKIYGTKSVNGPSNTPLPTSSNKVPVVSEQAANDEGYADL